MKGVRRGLHRVVTLNMDRRTKILAIAFGAVTAYLALVKVVYPNWLQPLLSLDERVAERREVLDRLESLDQQVMQARPEYRDYVARIGSFDAQSVVTDVRDRLNGLIQKHELQNAGVSPGTPRSNRKTGVETIVITVTAVGLLKSAVGFLRDVAELPHLMRVGNVALYPSKSSRSSDRNRRQELTHLRVPIELLVLPQQKVVGRIRLEGLSQPDSWVRHEGRDYSVIWSGKPFTQHIPPKPMKVNVGRDVTVKEGRSAKLRASVKGGDGQYTYEWSPKDGLKNVNGPNVEVDTTTPFKRSYTLTVTDGMGMSASDVVQVTVKERRKKTPTQPRKNVVKPRDPRWPHRRQMQVVMVLGWTGPNEQIHELMVYNKKLRETSYYAVGDEFDGGELVFVHQTGGLVHRTDGQYAIYPIGDTLDRDVSIEGADAFPELREAVERHRRMLKDAASEAQPGAGTDETGEPSAPVEGGKDKSPGGLP